MAGVPSASYSMTARLEIKNRPGMLVRVTSAPIPCHLDINPLSI
jgi:hypothetical protein